MEELSVAAEVRMTSVVGDRGKESGSTYGDEEGRREVPVCGSPGDALSTFEVERGRSGPE